jgi:chemotaxis protein MotB
MRNNHRKKFEIDIKNPIFDFTIILLLMFMLVLFLELVVASGLRTENERLRQENERLKELLAKLNIERVKYELEADVLFEKGKADWRYGGEERLIEAAEDVMDIIYERINASQDTLIRIEVEGHADPDPIETGCFPSNWELSCARAAKVVRFLEENSYAFVRENPRRRKSLSFKNLADEGKLSAIGYSYHIPPPGIPPDTESNKSKWRRIEIWLYFRPEENF